MLSTPFSWEESLQACYDHRLRLHNVWRAVGPTNEEVVDAVKQSGLLPLRRRSGPEDLLDVVEAALSGWPIAEGGPREGEGSNAVVRHSAGPHLDDDLRDAAVRSEGGIGSSDHDQLPHFLG
ncbi:hypothetical protein FOZ63_014263 [Perkinsus olseni]|uniref:Uncharacterized protein n=1 Tax=Perkinsus olseni TaxID=32597 RepID=A0A7J6RDX8_PEROL|nr:hypothetical protein FOZ63_014263 [Perkinsus olseni]